jgi:predicted transcriptional regulator
MTKLLQQAFEHASLLDPEGQDAVARAVLSLTGAAVEVVVLSLEERAAIEQSLAAAERGEFASEADVAAVWAKHGL